MPGAPGSPLALRLAKEGPPIEGLDLNDTLLWNPVDGMWHIGQVNALPNFGANGTFLISDGSQANWGNQIPLIKLGTGTCASSGELNGDNNWEAYVRNNVNSIDVRWLRWNADTLSIGNTGGGGAPIGCDVFYTGNTWQVRRTGNVAFEISTSIKFVQTAGVVEWDNGLQPTLRQSASSAGGVTGGLWTANAQDTTGNTSAGGTWDRRAGDSLVGIGPGKNGGNLFDRPGLGVNAAGNWGWFSQNSDAVNFQGMQHGVHMRNALAAPAGNPANGGFMYGVAGALTWRGSGGTVTVMGPA